MNMPTAIHCDPRTTPWIFHREAALNWLAFGLLLAAWNAADNDAASLLQSKPACLRGYAQVSVRAVKQHATGI